MKTGFKVGDAMTHNPISVLSSTSLAAVAKCMDEEHIGCVVVKDGPRFVGIATESSIVRIAVQDGLDPKTTPVHKAIVVDPLTIGPNEDIFQAMKLIGEHGTRQLPVMNKGALVGLLTLKDILKIQPQLYELMIERFELREAERKADLISQYKEGSVIYGEDIDH